MRTLVAAVALGVLACGYEPVDPPPTLPASAFAVPPSASAFAVPPSALAEFAGDRLDVASTSKAYRLLSDPGRDGFVRVANARIVTSTGIGIAGSRSPLADAFYSLLMDPQSKEAFVELAESTNPHAVLYGIAGLSLVDQSLATRYVRRWMGSREAVETMSGCVSSASSLSRLLHFDAAGHPVVWDEYWPSSLARPSRPDA